MNLQYPSILCLNFENLSAIKAFGHFLLLFYGGQFGAGKRQQDEWFVYPVHLVGKRHRVPVAKAASSSAFINFLK